MIPYGHQQISQADIDAVVAVLRSDFLTQGPLVPRFEQALTGLCGAKHGVAVNSATSALHIACLALGLSYGDRLWTVPNTFVASANCGLYCGADVDFVDVEPGTWNMSAPALREKLVVAARDGKLPKVVVPVHFGGQPTDEEAIWALAQEFGFKVLEDASHAIGASRNGEAVGSCRWSHITVFSFHPVKIVTSAEGGVALTNDAELAWKMALLRSHGITRDVDRMSGRSNAAWHYEQTALGFNYRMTDMQAALGLSQLTRLHDFVDQRNKLADRYNELLSRLPLQLPFVKAGNRSAFHLFAVRLIDELPADLHRKAFDLLRKEGIGVNLHYIPVHLQPYYRNLGFKEGSYPVSEAYGQKALSLPLYVGLTTSQQDYIADTLGRALV